MPTTPKKTSTKVTKKATTEVTKGNFDELTVNGIGGIKIGDPSKAGTTSLSISLSAASEGNSSLQSVKSAGTSWGDIILNPAGGNVGIGTTSPAERLEVNGRIQAGALTIGPWPGDPANWVCLGTNTLDQSKAGNYALLQCSSGDYLGWTLLNSPKTIQFRINNAEKMTLANNGNVGIGTTSPTATLEINGDVRICDKPLYLRRDGDKFHGLGWYGKFAETKINGPVVFGGGGGALGTTGDGEKIALAWNNSGIKVTGDITATGDVLLLGADCAEDFNIAGVEDIEAGTVMVICQDGALRPSQESYDKRVAGVISGAGDFKPGIVLDKQAENTETQRRPLALVGKVFCKVDANYAPIEVGDLLTTSPTPGHGMKADDPAKAFGTVIGKALRGLESGQGLIPILIALQ